MTDRDKTTQSRRAFLAFFLVLSVAGFVAAVPTNQDADRTRHLWDTAYPKPETRRASSGKAVQKSSYRIATPRVPAAGVTADTVIGVTLWRLRPAAASESGERLIVHAGAEAGEWLPERVSADSQLKAGDRLRISIEAARTGYLYVVDRERYADGSVGEPSLIFPTTRTRGGDNQVQVGRVIEIPAQDDRPPYFTLRHSRPDHVAEDLIVLVSPTPIEGLQITDKAQKLAGEQVAAWERLWGGPAGRLELLNGAGKQWTRAEKDAGLDGTRALTEDDPTPQTIYYVPGVSGAKAVLVKVQLRYAKSPRRVGR